APCRWLGSALIAQGSDRSEQFAAMSDESDAEILQILSGQLGQHGSVDRVVAKGLFVLLQPETAEPHPDVHARLPGATTDALQFTLTQTDAMRDYSAGWSPARVTRCMTRRKP